MTGTADTAPKVNKIQTNYKASFANLKALARGQWPAILTYYGIPSECFSRKKNIHVNCPIPRHGGAKDFRFDNENDNGSYICTCSSGKDGFNLLAAFLSIENADAIKLVAEYFSKNNTPTKPTYAPITVRTRKQNQLCLNYFVNEPTLFCKRILIKQQ